MGIIGAPPSWSKKRVRAALAQAVAIPDFECLFVDGSIVRVHQYGTGKKERDLQAVRRSRGVAHDLRDVLKGHDGVVHPLDVADHQSFGDMDYDAWAETLEVNTFGPYRVIEALPDNVESGHLC